jgi:hypothetical protein
MVKIFLKRASFLFLLLFLASCGETTAKVTLTYHPLFAPVTFSIDTNGNISVQGDLAIETPAGTFTLSAGVSDSPDRPQPDNSTLLLIIRHKQGASLADSYYRMQTEQDEVVIVTNGTTTIDVTSHKAFIDASKGDVKSITVKDANSATDSSVTEAPTPIPGPTIASAANLIIHFYDEKGDFAGNDIIKDITSMTLPQPQAGQITSCVAYEAAQLPYPEAFYQADSRTFTLQFDGSGWTVVSMGGNESCVVDPNGTAAPSQTFSANPPAFNQAVPLIKTYYDKDWNGIYVMDSVESMRYRQQVGDYIGACVYYTYHAPNHPNDPQLYFHAEFSFAYNTGTWKVNKWDQYGCGPTNYN